MKRIFLVLVLLTVAAGMAFSVTGKIFLRYAPAGPVASRWGADTFDDLWLGKVNSGFEVNFDGFTFQYQLRDGMTSAGSYVLNIISNQAGNVKQQSTSPGYFRISGVKAGPVDLAVGLQWNTLMSDNKSIVTNPAILTNATNKTFNQVYVDLTFGVKLADNMEIKVKDWDRIYFTTEMGSWGYGQTNGAGVIATNNAQTPSAYATRIPVWFILSGTGYNYEARGTLKMSGKNVTYAGTNTVANSALDYEVLVRGSFDLNDTFGIWTAVGFQGGSASLATNYSASNVIGTESSYMQVPIFVGLLYKMAPGITWDIGAGYIISLARNSQVNTGTTNMTSTTTGLFGDYADWSDNWNNPFLHVGGTGKAGDWELGLNFNVLFKPVNSDSKVTDKGTAGTGIAYNETWNNGILSFLNNVNYDENVYIKWAKDQIEIQGVLGAAPGNTAVASATLLEGNIMNLFAVLNLTVKF